jgi:hypothetical protein
MSKDAANPIARPVTLINVNALLPEIFLIVVRRKFLIMAFDIL